MGMGFWTDLCCSQYLLCECEELRVLFYCPISKLPEHSEMRWHQLFELIRCIASVCQKGLYTWQHSFRHIINRSKNMRRIRPLENKRKLAWKDELRTMVAQDCFTCVSCPQAQLHLLVYFVFFVVKHDPDGMQHLPKLPYDCGCPSKLYSTCHTQVERKISQ